MFLIQGGTYSVCSAVWGLLIQRSVNGFIVAIIGGSLTVIAALLIGPAPFIPLPTSLPLCCIALFLNGVGFSAQFTSYLLIAKDSIFHNVGKTNDVEKHAMFAGILVTIYSTGFFVGPTLGGLFVDTVHYEIATLFVAFLQLFLLIITVYYYYRRNCVTMQQTTTKGDTLSKEVQHYQKKSYDSLSLL